MSRLDGKVAVVTGGGGSGIGHGISLVLAREGAHVAILEIDLDAAEEVRRQIEAGGGKASVSELRSLTPPCGRLSCGARPAEGIACPFQVFCPD